MKFDAKRKAVIAKYASENGVACALRNFKGKKLQKAVFKIEKWPMRDNINKSFSKLKKRKQLVLD